MINALEVYRRLKGEYDKTDQPLRERSSILPFGQYEDGSVGLAWPEILAAPAEGIANFGSYGYGEDAVPYNSRMAFDAAGGAMTGGLGVGLAGGMVDNAVGSAGTRAYRGAASPESLVPTGSGGRSSGAMWMSSDPAVAGTYGDVTPLDVRFQNPFEIDAQGAAWGGIPLEDGRTASIDVLARLARMRGNDGLVVRNVMDQADQSIPMAPADTMAALRPGTVYSATTGDLLYSNAPSGSSVPLALNALERAQPQVSKNLAGRDVYDFGDGTQVTMKDWPSGGRFVDSVWTDPASRGQGQARQAMDYILAEADSSGTPLRLSVAPGDLGVDPQRLQSFYEGLGFDYLGGSYMKRDPRANAPTGAAIPASMEASDTDPALLEYLKLYGL